MSGGVGKLRVNGFCWWKPVAKRAALGEAATAFCKRPDCSEPTKSQGVGNPRTAILLNKFDCWSTDGSIFNSNQLFNPQKKTIGINF